MSRYGDLATRRERTSRHELPGVDFSAREVSSVRRTGLFSVGVVVVVRPERFVIRRDVRTAADLPRRADHPLEVHVVLDERAEVMVILAEVVERDLAVLFEDLRNTK